MLNYHHETRSGTNLYSSTDTRTNEQVELPLKTRSREGDPNWFELMVQTDYKVSDVPHLYIECVLSTADEYDVTVATFGTKPSA